MSAEPKTSSAKGRSPRASFVVTVAAAALVGCGGQVGPGSGDDPDPPSNPPFDTGVGEIGASDVRPDVTPGCPKTQPRNGDPCSGVTYCDYTTCGPSGGGGAFFRCVDGQFTDKGGGSSCNPPPPVCPSAAPDVGSPCATGSFGSCSYPDTCLDRPAGAPTTDYLSCRGTWAISGPDYTAACPSVAPVDGSSCRCGNHYYGHCTYSACLGAPTIDARCSNTTGLWSVISATCNPPGPDAGSGEGGSAEAGSGEAGSGP